MKTSTFLLLLAALTWGSFNGFAQDKSVSGKVTDTSGVAIANALISIPDQKDTIKTTTDTSGYFTVTNLKGDHFILIVSHLNYESFTRIYSFSKMKGGEVETIRLEPAYHQLEEVIVRSKPNPIKVMQDTIEYNAAAFSVFEGDNVADLIKQFQGVDVDENYNVQFMGENVVKLRVNGKDFFTNNVKDFIAKLPAEIVSKIQIIDDYGDQANFTGIKLGEPRKMLNIVTKPGMDSGKFGNMGITGGTNRQLRSDNDVNLWQGDKQTSGGLHYSIQDNGAGTAENAGLSWNHRRKMGKQGSIAFNYELNGSSSDFKNEQAVETVSSIGTYYNTSRNNGHTRNSGHQLGANFYTRTDDIFMNGSIAAGYRRNATGSESLNSQSGVARQDVNNQRDASGRSPNIDANFNIGKRAKGGSTWSVDMAYSASAQQNDQIINTHTLYYDQQNNSLLKDSVLNRNIYNRNNSQVFSLNGTYTIPLASGRDSSGKKNIVFTYAVSAGNTHNNAATYVLNGLSSKYNFIDSLSTEFTSLFINQTIGASYHYSGKKMRYTVGITVKPMVLKNNYMNLHQEINNTNLNYSPALNLSRTISKSKTLTASYSGDNNSPQPNQLQPVRNTQNLQNIIIGNPALKPFFQHRVNAGYRYAALKSGISLLGSASFSTTQNEIVQNVIMIPDTLGSYKQETRYENTNGSYNVNGNYTLNIPVKKNTASVSYGGSVGLSNKALFINNTRYYNNGLNFSQNISGTIRLKKLYCNARIGYSQANNNNVVGLFATALEGGGTSIPVTFNPGQFATTNFFVTRSLSANASGRLELKGFGFNSDLAYTYSSNTSTAVKDGDRDLQTLSLALKGNATFKKRYSLYISASKRINSGYALANQNPLLLGFSISCRMLKNQALALIATGSDLLAQGNVISRQVYGNSIVDSRSNVITRVFSLRLNYSLSNFGAKGTYIRVDPD